MPAPLRPTPNWRATLPLLLALLFLTAAGTTAHAQNEPDTLIGRVVLSGHPDRLRMSEPLFQCASSSAPPNAEA